MEELQAKHRKQLRDLQSQITQKKKSASKKTRKSVNDECARLEQDLKDRQAAETQAQAGTEPPSSHPPGASPAAATSPQDDDLLASIADLSTQESTDPPHATENGHAESEGNQARRPNRQKARLARRAAEQDAAASQAAEEAANLPDMKTQERNNMLEHMSKRGLVEKEVAANGHCLYLSVADQMTQLKLDVHDPVLKMASSGSATSEKQGDVKVVRSTAADYISKHPDDFAPFIDEDLADYVSKIRDTGEWGGQLELLALAKSYGIDINVLQADGSIVKVESGSSSSRGDAWLAYYRHGFGLGEHYNSLRSTLESKPAG